jgi:hypothetical protein
MGRISHRMHEKRRSGVGVALKSEKRLLRPYGDKNANTTGRAFMQQTQKGARRPLFYRHQGGTCMLGLSCSASNLFFIQQKGLLTTWSMPSNAS